MEMSAAEECMESVSCSTMLTNSHICQCNSLYNDTSKSQEGESTWPGMEELMEQLRADERVL
jgi:hypothetical protein